MTQQTPYEQGVAALAGALCDTAQDHYRGWEGSIGHGVTTVDHLGAAEEMLATGRGVWVTEDTLAEALRDYGVLCGSCVETARALIAAHQPPTREASE